MARCDADVDCGSFVYYDDGLQEAGEPGKKWCKFYVHDAMAYRPTAHGAGGRLRLARQIRPGCTPSPSTLPTKCTSAPTRETSAGCTGRATTTRPRAARPSAAQPSSATATTTRACPPSPSAPTGSTPTTFPRRSTSPSTPSASAAPSSRSFKRPASTSTPERCSRALVRVRASCRGADRAPRPPRPRHTTTTRYGESWEWPDAVPSGIDQFHGKTLITSLERTRAHTRTHTHKHTCTRTRTHALAYSRTRFACRRAL